VFRAENGLPGFDGELVAFGTGQFLTPELLSRKIAATTGIHWYRSYERVEKLISDYNLLYGGIDSNSITKRLRAPNGIMSNIALRMASEMSCMVTAYDFSRPKADRRLFPHVETSFRPIDDNGYEVPQAQAAIKRNIQALHERLLGEELVDGDPELERTYLLFLETFRELRATNNTSLTYSCQARWDRDKGPSDGWDLPASRIIDRDSDYTIRSWMAVMTYLLADWKFLHE
jgi:hypothetical protein